MGTPISTLLAQSPVVDALAVLTFAYAALVGVAAIRDRSAPRMVYGLSLLAAGREPMLRMQHTALWLGAILIGVVVLYQAHFAATLPVRTLVLSVGGASVFIVGLALQSTLGNVSAGYALQTSRVLRKGDVVQLGHRGPIGTVWDSTLGTTRILLRDGELLVLPNSAVLQKDFMNLDQPTRRLRQSIQVGVGYDAPPAVVKDVALSVLHTEPLVLKDPEPDVWEANFPDSSMTYDLRLWIASHRDRDAANDRIRTRL